MEHPTYGIDVVALTLAVLLAEKGSREDGNSIENRT